jgi:RNA polymerase sigma factor (sigma-70 family)
MPCSGRVVDASSPLRCSPGRRCKRRAHVLMGAQAGALQASHPGRYLFQSRVLYSLKSRWIPPLGFRTLTVPNNHRFVAGMAAKYGGRLRRFLKLRLPNASDVPDLAQEVFLRLMRVPNHEDIRSPEAYLFTVASHVVHQHHQKQVTAPVSLEAIESFAQRQFASSDDPTARTEVLERLEHLERTLDALPPRVARALLLHRLGGHSIGEIAGDLGVAQITVKKYLARASCTAARRGRESPHERAAERSDSE